jgi:hypothetical protein
MDAVASSRRPARCSRCGTAYEGSAWSELTMVEIVSPED